MTLISNFEDFNYFTRRIYCLLPNEYKLIMGEELKKLFFRKDSPNAPKKPLKPIKVGLNASDCPCLQESVYSIEPIGYKAFAIIECFYK